MKGAAAMPKGKFSMSDLLNSQSKTEAAPVSSFVVKDIPLDKISVSPSNKYGIRDIEELAASIEEVGLLHNLVVKAPDEKGVHELISGERRYLALKLLERPTAPCKVEGRGDATFHELKLIHANATARVLTDYEKTMQAARIKELLQEMKAQGHKFKGRMRDIVAEILKVSSAQVGRMESIEKHLAPELKEEFKEGKIGISAAYETSILKPDEQAAALEAYRDTGELPAKKAATAPPPPKPQPEERGEDEIRAKIEEYKAQDALKAPKTYPPPPTPERPKRAYVKLVQEPSTVASFTGDLAFIAAVDVDADEFNGAFSSGEGFTALDYIQITKAVCMACLEQMAGDDMSIEIMRANLAALFKEGEM